MRKTFFAAVVIPLAALALLSPSTAVGSPPEAPSGKTVLAPDEVADGLRQYRKECDWLKRLNWLKKLAPTGDPRVAVAIMDFSFSAVPEFDRSDAEHYTGFLLAYHFVARTHFDHVQSDGKARVYDVGKWRSANEADIRRRAKQLSR
jgi:hypothetical protein